MNGLLADNGFVLSHTFTPKCITICVDKLSLYGCDGVNEISETILLCPQQTLLYRPYLSASPSEHGLDKVCVRFPKMKVLMNVPIN